MLILNSMKNHQILKYLFIFLCLRVASPSHRIYLTVSLFASPNLQSKLSVLYLWWFTSACLVFKLTKSLSFLLAFQNCNRPSVGVLLVDKSLGLSTVVCLCRPFSFAFLFLLSEIFLDLCIHNRLLNPLPCQVVAIALSLIPTTSFPWQDYVACCSIVGQVSTLPSCCEKLSAVLLPICWLCLFIKSLNILNNASNVYLCFISLPKSCCFIVKNVTN